MASYTEHYQLHQWEPEDPFLRTDFNEDLAKIDTAIADAAVSPGCIMGAYVGNSTVTNIELGFHPSFLQILATGRDTNLVYDVMSAIGGNGHMIRITRNASCGLTTVCQPTESGFTITEDSDTGLNATAVTYSYLAFY